MNWIKRRIVLVAGVLALVLIVGAAGGFLRGTFLGPHFVEYAMLEPLDTPTAIAAAPDGTVWFTLDHAAAIGRLRAGRLERLPIAGSNVEPIGIATAADGSVWFTDLALGGISRMALSGETVGIRLETPIVRIGRLAVAPDGAAWFAEPTSYSITRLKDGALTRHVPESPRGGPYGVAVAPDGAVWATLQSGNQLLRIDAKGEMTAIDVPRQGVAPTDIAVGRDGAVWFIEFRGNRIGRLEDGKFDEYEVGEENAGLTGLAAAPDGAVWFGMLRSGSIGRLLRGRTTTFRLPRERARPYSVAVDRDGNVWYADIAGYVGMLPARYAGG